MVVVSFRRDRVVVSRLPLCPPGVSSHPPCEEEKKKIIKGKPVGASPLLSVHVKMTIIRSRDTFFLKNQRSRECLRNDVAPGT